MSDRLMQTCARATMIVAVLAVTAPSYAQDRSAAQRDEDAKKHYKRGRAYHDLEQYDKAIEHYQRAYEVSKAAKLLFNIAQAHRLNGDKTQAIEYYDKYLAREPDDSISDIAREEREQLVRELKAEEAARRAERARKAEKAREAKQRRAQAAKEARAAEQARKAEEVRKAEEARQRYAREAPLRVWRGKKRRARILRISAYAAGAGSLVAFASAAKFGLDAGSISDDLSEAGPWTSDKHERFEDGRAAERNMYILYGVGAGALLVAGGLYYLGVRAEPEQRPTAITVTPTAGPSSVGLSFTGRF